MNPLKECIGYALSVYLDQRYPLSCFLLKISDRSILFSVEDNRVIDTSIIVGDLLQLLSKVKEVRSLGSSVDSCYTDRLPTLQEGTLKYQSIAEIYPEIGPKFLDKITTLISTWRVKKKSRSLRFEFSQDATTT